MSVPLARQIACVERELVMRRKVYPRRVAAGAMTQSQATGETEAMEAVLTTLRELATKEPLPLFQREEDQ